jgi:phosphoribosylformylglycinamidine synthase
MADALPRAQAERLAGALLADPLVESYRIDAPLYGGGEGVQVVEVVRAPGVMDPVVGTLHRAAADLGSPLGEVCRIRQFTVRGLDGNPDPKVLLSAVEKTVANPVIERVLLNRPWEGDGREPPVYRFERREIPLRGSDEAGLRRLSREGGLSLKLHELQVIRRHFRELGREPTDVELETLAQTWSEHCLHKTFRSPVVFDGRRYENLLKETIFRVTEELALPWCVSVFSDNAGIIAFDADHHLCFKVETHNHPSAVEPYGGASTGLGGVIRDLLGCGLGAEPIAGTDVFCLGPWDLPLDRLPPGSLHPRRVLEGVVAGVRDYGNRMGIPTVNGALCFHEGFVCNPLVFCGNVGLIPKGRVVKSVRPGDRIFVIGGRTGRDGIHGATFSSARLDGDSETSAQGAVQIGDPIAEKRVLDLLLEARELGLYRSITDCGAGGLSSAIGEMGARCGCRVHLDRVPLKYAGLSYREIWISEAQERMVLAVPPGSAALFLELCGRLEVEATELGEFADDRMLRLFYQGHPVVELSMDFLHEACPRPEREAVRRKIPPSPLPPAGGEGQGEGGWGDRLCRVLAHPDVCSKEWVIRQYDHEVQGRTVLKPLQGVDGGGPGDACVLAPVYGSRRGIAIGCGIKVRYGLIDPGAMAASAIDEAIRQVVSVGGDPDRTALLDNFCWGDTDDPEVLGDLVQAAEACYATAKGFGTPFISGKDSLHNSFEQGRERDGRVVSIPPVLLVSSLASLEDVGRAVTIDFKEAGNPLYLLGMTRDEMGGSVWADLFGSCGGAVPRVDPVLHRSIYRKLHETIREGWVRACHDCSDGGLAVAVSEMAFAGGLGVELDLSRVPVSGDVVPAALLFGESNGRLCVEVARAHAEAFQRLLGGLPCARVGEVRETPRAGISERPGHLLIDEPIDRLREAWRLPLERAMS